MMTETEYMKNAQGHLVPTGKVKAEDKLEDSLVRDLHDAAEKLSKALAIFKTGAFSDVDSFLSLLAEQYHVAKGGSKGNVTLTSYDGLTKVQVQVADFIQFGPQLQVAKQLIDECITDWGTGANENLRAIVNDAFQVDKAGQISTTRILGLRRLSISDEKWKRAMDAITDSMRVMDSKRYIRLYRRHSPEAQWDAVVLDVARV